MSYLRYLCLFVYSGVQHILSCVFVLFVFFLYLVYPVLPVSLDCSFLIASLVSLTFIYQSKAKFLYTDLFIPRHRFNYQWSFILKKNDETIFSILNHVAVHIEPAFFLFQKMSTILIILVNKINMSVYLEQIN